MNYKRISIGENIGFSTIIEKKFNTSLLNIRFITELSEKTSSANSISNGIIAMSNKNYKDIGEMNKAISELYGANITSYSGESGDAQILSISASWICNRFAFENEDIDAKMLEIIHDCIFCPYAENGKFNERNLKVAKKDVIDNIKSELNDKRSYAINEAYKIAFRGEPAENSCIGTIEKATEVTAESAFEAYRNMLETAHIEISYVTPEENPAVAEMFRKGFADIKRSSKTYRMQSNSPLKQTPENVTKEFDVNQSKIVLVFKSDTEDKLAANMFSLILGGTPVSKLFANVREKMSLCYYCSSSYSKGKNVLVVDSGVEKANIEKAYAEIMNQIEEIKNGNISDNDIQAALLALDNVYSGVGDTPARCSSWYFERLCDNNIMTPQEYFNEICKVTKERIIKTASSFRLDCSYYMINKETVE